MPFIKKLTISAFAAIAATGSVQAKTLNIEAVSLDTLVGHPVSDQAITTQIKPVMFLSEEGLFKPKAKTEAANWARLTPSEIAELDKDVVSCQPCVVQSSPQDSSIKVCAAVPIEGNEVVNGYKAAKVDLTFNEEDVQCFCPMVAVNSSTNNMSVDVEKMPPLFDWEAKAETAACFVPVSKNAGNGGVGAGTAVCSDDCGVQYSFASLLSMFDNPLGHSSGSRAFRRSRVLGSGGNSAPTGVAAVPVVKEDKAPVLAQTDPLPKKDIPQKSNDISPPWNGGEIPVVLTPYEPFDPYKPMIPEGSYVPPVFPINEEKPVGARPVPEPATSLLLGTGAAIFAWAARRKKYKVKFKSLNLG